MYWLNSLVYWTIEGELYELRRQRNIDDRLQFLEMIGLGGGAKKQLLGEQFKKAAEKARAKSVAKHMPFVSKS